MERTFDSAWLNELANEPSIRPHVGPGTHALDLTSFIRNKNNYVMRNDHGCFIGHHRGGGMYEVHTLMRRTGWGRVAFNAAKEGMSKMFLSTDCSRLVTQTPKSNRRAKGLTVMTGFKKDFERDSGFMGPTEYWSMNIWDWIRATDFSESGQWFHDELERQGESADHKHDQAHDKYVGLAVEMIKARQHRKALAIYNDWALLAGYMPIFVVSESPLKINIHTAVLTMKNDKFEVEAVCQ